MKEKQNDLQGENKFRVKRDRLSLSLMLAAALIATAGFATFFVMWFGRGLPNEIETLRIATRRYVEGDQVIAGELAKLVQLDTENEELAEWIALKGFLVGAGEIARARKAVDLEERRQRLYDAIIKFEAVAAKGFPAGREVEGRQLLGESLFELGRFEQATLVLRQVVERDPTKRRSLMPMLAKAKLRQAEPLPARALDTIEEYLADPTLRLSQRREGDLVRIEALTQLGQFRDAEQAINRALKNAAAEHSSEPLRIAEFTGQLRLARAVMEVTRTISRYGKEPSDVNEDRSCVVEELFETIEDLNRLQREGLPQVAAHARVWSARAYLCQGMPELALAELTVVRQQRPFGAEAIVGSLEEIELLARAGLGKEMLQSVRFVMQELGDKRNFDGSIISFAEFQRRLVIAMEKLRDQGEYEAAIDIARLLPPVFDPAEALTQEGIGYREWAANTLAQGVTSTGDISENAAMLARTRFRSAGDAFAESARLDFDTPRYLATQWAAIDAYQQGRFFQRSIRLLNPYLRYEDRRRQPRGLVALGRALLAENNPAEAIKSLETCVEEFPRDPLRYDARLLLAMAYSEIGELEKSRASLMDNLQDGELTPQSPAWRDSLFTLAEILYQKGFENHLKASHAADEERADLLKANQPVIEEAVRRLTESVERYWPSPRAELAAYMAARAHALAAEWPRLESRSPNVLDAARRSLRAKADSEIEAAFSGFVKLKEALLQREDEQRLSEGSRSLLRNCFMSEADTLKEMGRLDEACTAYRTVALRYMNEPPALEAILAQTQCLRLLGRDNEANLLIRQAELVLQQIPPALDDQFQKLTRYDRQGWQELLAWMNAAVKEQNT